MSNYNVDISGVLAANRITNEQAVIVPGSADIHKQLPYIIPQFAPFYGPNFVIRRNGVALTKDIDYQFAAQHLHAKAFLGKEFYGAVVFLDRSAVGNVEYDYNTLGGNYVTNDSQLLAAYFNTLVQQRVINWDKVYGVPALLPPIQAQENLALLAGTDDLITSINALAAAIGAADFNNIVSMINAVSSSLSAHALAENPHGTGKDNVGLGDVANFNYLQALGQILSTGASKRYLTTGTSAEWDTIRNAILQLTQGAAQNPLTSNSSIFLSDTLANISLPNGAAAAGQLLIIQIKLSADNTATLSQSNRLQIGILINPVSEGAANPAVAHVLLRQLPVGAVGVYRWTVIPNWSSISTALATVSNNIPTAVNAALDARLTYGEHDPTAGDFTNIGDIYFKLA